MTLTSDEAAACEGGTYCAFDRIAVTAEAGTLIDAFCKAYLVREEKTPSRVNRRRAKTQAKIKAAMEGFLSELIHAAYDDQSGGWVFRSLKAEKFSGLPFSIKTFRPIVDMLTETGYIEPHKANAIVGVRKAHAASWRATERLLRRAEERGISSSNFTDHFRRKLPEAPLVLRAEAIGRGKDKVQGRVISYEVTPQALALEADVRRLNAFLDGIEIEGGNHDGYTRIFNNGTPEGYQWDQGGRLYSRGPNSYQSKSKAERSLIRIEGDATKEIDVQASGLTLLHGVLGKPFCVADDPYDLEGLLASTFDKETTRWVVKKWTVAALGQGKPLSRWPREAIDEFSHITQGLKLGQCFSVREVKAAMEEKHPALSDWFRLEMTWGSLMHIESEAVLGAMLGLMDDYQIPSLTIHDSLIVRAQDVEAAEGALRSSYASVCGIEPCLVVS